MWQPCVSGRHGLALLHNAAGQQDSWQVQGLPGASAQRAAWLLRARQRQCLSCTTNRCVRAAPADLAYADDWSDKGAGEEAPGATENEVVFAGTSKGLGQTYQPKWCARFISRVPHARCCQGFTLALHRATRACELPANMGSCRVTKRPQ